MQALGLWSEEASFRALPAPGPEASVSLLAVADLGQAEVDGSADVVEMRAARNTAALMAAEAHRHQLLVNQLRPAYWEAGLLPQSPLKQPSKPTCLLPLCPPRRSTTEMSPTPAATAASGSRSSTRWAPS